MLEVNGKKYKELRCSQCQKFIVHITAFAADVLYICPKCGYTNEFTFKFLSVPSVLDFVLKCYTISKKGGE